MYLYHNIENDLVIDVNYIYHRSEIIQTLKNKFASFGYKEIYTPTFQPYDLYVHMNGTVNHQEMMKTIDNTGNVLVLRPDVTIPLTQQIALVNKKIQEDLRYFYILDVFRQTFGTTGNRENTQAGVEYFGNATPAADAEIIALSIHVLQGIDSKNVKIELGHAGFFKQLIHEMDMEKQDLQELRDYIQAKNVPEIEQLLKRLNVTDNLKEIVTSLPFLYGEPGEVIQKAKELPLSEAMVTTLDNLSKIHQNLQAYGIDDHIVIDLSLINHMDYYSDMIFQGFIENVGKPVLMGGRYDTLAEQFDAHIPAIGFACNLELLLENIEQNMSPETATLDLCIRYDDKSINKSMTLANQLRNNNYQVVTYSKATESIKIPAAKYFIELVDDRIRLICEDNDMTFQSAVELIAFLQKGRD